VRGCNNLSSGGKFKQDLIVCKDNYAIIFEVCF